MDGIATRGSAAAIPSRKNRTARRDVDTDRYKDRNRGERFGAKATPHRRVATRCDETARNFLARAHIMILLR
ncbi:hypothetical protein C1280_03075 [Gemmata obscuriglobus]|uniref:Transposase DDE domain-containing protein n=1 Tax=Gemmata obscuriglobus TaxID=114 RepID=A0A2Z3GU68_9BACT|nr:hypothetical protein C1280_03075 [Gemmata obscuriglobus]